MSDAFSIWTIVPMAASLTAAIAILIAAVFIAKPFKPFRSDGFVAIAVTTIVLATGIAVYMPMHVYATREYNRANTDWWELVEIGDTEGAEKKLLRQLEGLRNSYGRVHPDHSPILFNLAQVYKEQGRLEEAEQKYLDTLNLLRSESDEHTDRYCDGLRQTAMFFWGTNDYATAEQYYYEGLEASRAEYGDDHGSTIRFLRDLAASNKAQEDYDDAELYYQELMTTAERVDVTRLTEYGSGYIRMLVKLGRESEAEALRKRWELLEAEGDY